MTPEFFIKQIKGKEREIKQLVNRTLPIKAGAIAKEHFRKNFLDGGFTDDGLKKWKPAKRLSQGGKSAAGNRPTLLSERDMLYNDIKAVPGNAEVKISTTSQTQDYAQVHNEGLRSGRGKGFQMPKRKFIGESKELNEKIKNLIEDEVGKIFN
jgi:phage gpG-like protein